MVSGRYDENIGTFFSGLCQSLRGLNTECLGRHAFSENDAMAVLLVASYHGGDRSQVQCFIQFRETVYGFPAQIGIIDINMKNDHSIISPESKRHRLTSI